MLTFPYTPATLWPHTRKIYVPEVQPDTPVKRRHLEHVVNAFCLQDHTVESQEEAMNKPLMLNQPLLQQKGCPSP